MYTHVVQYHETDMMKITHHSNYILWMEEARTHYLRTVGLDYADMEKSGILVPVTDISVRFLKPTTFEDVITVKLSLASYTGVTCSFSYRIYNEHNTLCCEGETRHCFTDVRGRPIILKRQHPELDIGLAALVKDK